MVRIFWGKIAVIRGMLSELSKGPVPGRYLGEEFKCIRFIGIKGVNNCNKFVYITGSVVYLEQGH